jgi:hypothetical protein
MTRHRFLSSLILMTFLAGACNPATQVPPTVTLAPTEPPTATTIPFTSTPAFTATPGLVEGDFVLESTLGKPIAGTIYGSGETVVVLANQGSNDRYRWDPLVEALVANGFTVVTFVYSYSTENFGVASSDLGILMDYLVQKGRYRRFVCIGGSLGTIACATKKNRPEVVGIVLMAGPSGVDLSEATFPKLFITGETDACCALATKAAYNRADEPKTFITYPTGAHAVTLFGTVYAEEITGEIVTFVKGLP